MGAVEVPVGQRYDLTIITADQGPVMPGLVDSCDLTPDLAQKVIMSIANQDPSAIVNTHNGVTGKFSATETNELALYAALQNSPLAPTNVSPAAILNDFRKLRNFHVLINKKKDTNDSSIGGWFAYNCKASGASAPMSSGDVTKRDIPFKGLRLDDIRGMQLAYRRARATATLETTPGTPTTAEMAGGNFNGGDVVYIRIAQSGNANTGATPPPTATEPLSAPTFEQADPIAGAAQKVVVTFVAPPAAGKSFAIYVGRSSGQETFYGWAAAAAATFDITGYAEATSPRPTDRNVSGAVQLTGDLIFGVIGGFTYGVDLLTGGGKLAEFLQPTGLPYIAVMKNGVRQPEPHGISTGFGFDVTGRYFFLSAAPSVQDAWELILPVDPN
jgi:hypothetical protein